MFYYNFYKVRTLRPALANIYGHRHTNIADKLLENEEKPESTLNLGFIAWLDALSSNDLDRIFAPGDLTARLKSQQNP